MKHTSLEQYFNNIKTKSLDPLDKTRVFSRIQQLKRTQSFSLLSRFHHITRRTILASIMILFGIGVFAPYLFDNHSPLIISYNGLDVIAPLWWWNGTVQAAPIGTIVESQWGFTIINQSWSIQTGIMFTDGDTIILNTWTSLRFVVNSGTATASVQWAAKLTVTRQQDNNQTIFLINLLEGDYLSVTSADSWVNNNHTVAVQTQDSLIRQTSSVLDIDIKTTNGRKTVVNKWWQIAVTTTYSQQTKLVAQYNSADISVDVQTDIKDTSIIAANFKEKTYKWSYSAAIDNNTLNILQTNISPEHTDNHTSNTNHTSDTTNVSLDINTSLETDQSSIITTARQQDTNIAATSTPTISISTDTTEKVIIDKEIFVLIDQLTQKTFVQNDLIDISITYLQWNTVGMNIAIKNLQYRITKIANTLDITISPWRSLQELIEQITDLTHQISKRYYISPRITQNLTSTQQRLRHLISFDIGSYSPTSINASSSLLYSGSTGWDNQIISVSPYTIYQILNISPSTYPLR